jgi:V/A-type H+/Na+-transporting ATPase subunit A
MHRGDSIYQMMQVTGEAGITLEDFVTWQKSVLLDMVYLQQDAFDAVDASMPRDRQLESFRLLKGIIDKGYSFKNKDEARSFFTHITGYTRTGTTAWPTPPNTAVTGRRSKSWANAGLQSQTRRC